MLGRSGLNEGLTDDTTESEVSIIETDPCLGINTNGHGTCENGLVTCDEGFANDDVNPNEDCDGCDTGYRNYPTCEVIPAPEITGLGIHCSSTGGYCLSNWPTPYSANFNVENATDCVANAIVVSGNGSPGNTSAVTVNGNVGSLNYTSGSDSGDLIRVSVTCNGPGGSGSDSTDITLE